MTTVRPTADSVLENLGMAGAADGEKMDLSAMDRALAAVLDLPHLPDVTSEEMLRWLTDKDPHLFFAAAIARLELVGGPPGHRKRSLRLLDAPAFLLELVRSERFSIRELIDFCAKYVREDSLLDVKLARLMPGRQSNSYDLEPSLILRIMEVLDEISPGPRLLMIIGHLTHYPEQHVASKAALLVGRRLQSREWIERHLSSTDARVRANVIEALWGIDSALAAHTLGKCLHDENNRVLGNAIVGLHMLGDNSARWRINQLTKDRRPAFRQTAAWVIGKVGDPEFTTLLEGMLLDPVQGVRQSAKSALQRLRAPATNTFEPDFSPNIGMVVAPDCAKTRDAPAKPAIEGERAATTTDSILELADKLREDEVDEDEELVPGRQKSELAPTLRLDGRCVTGA
jgi:hypothetical protein